MLLSDIPFEEWLPLVTPRWVWDWAFQRVIYGALGRMTRGEIDRLMLSLPPRHTKTEMVTIRYAAYRLLREPGLRVIIGAYNQTLANKFSRRIRRLVEEAGLPLSRERKAAEEWETTQGGGVRAVGVSGGITGMGGDLIIIDDPVKSRAEADSPAYRERCHEWYTDDLTTRLEPGGQVILIMTRWHASDLAGSILASEEAPEWAVINLPALAEGDDLLGRQPGEALCPARYDVEALLRRRRALGERSFNALFQGRPSAAGGGIFARHGWRYWHLPGPPPPPVQVRRADGALVACAQEPLPGDFELWAQSWDCAFLGAETSDFVVGQVWGRVGADRYLLDQTRGRLDAAQTLEAIRQLSARWPQTFAKYIENKANGPAMIAMLKRQIAGLIPVNPQGGKIARANAVQPQIEAGNVYLPHPSLLPWSQTLVEEAAAFPNGAHDDQVDAMTQLLLRWSPADMPPAEEGQENEAEVRFVERLARLRG